MALINTTIGLVEIADLDIKTKEEKISCGIGITTSYFLGERLVRQDQEIRVDQALTAAGRVSFPKRLARSLLKRLIGG
jgi:hypothetical protein